MKFEQWLRGEIIRKDHVGQLAEYYIKLGCPRTFNLSTLKKTQPSFYLIEAYHLAKEEHRKKYHNRYDGDLKVIKQLNRIEKIINEVYKNLKEKKKK